MYGTQFAAGNSPTLVFLIIGLLNLILWQRELFTFIQGAEVSNIIISTFVTDLKILQEPRILGEKTINSMEHPTEKNSQQAGTIPEFCLNSVGDFSSLFVFLISFLDRFCI
jgi:hypothetical protein